MEEGPRVWLGEKARSDGVAGCEGGRDHDAVEEGHEEDVWVEEGLERVA